MYITLGIITSIVFILCMVGDILYLSSKIYKCWLNDEPLNVGKTHCPFVSGRVDFLDIIFGLIFIRFIIGITGILVCLMVWPGVWIVAIGIIAAKYHKYITRLKKAASDV